MKLKFSACIVIFLTLLNLRGVKESVLFWVPVFFLFVLTYAFAIVYGVASHAGELPGIANGVASDVQTTSSQIGLWGMMVVILRAYSLGAGTYTGIEAVSNGLTALREPRVQTGKRTMVYMAVSLVVRRRRIAAGVSAVSCHAGSGKNLERRFVRANDFGVAANVGKNFRYRRARVLGGAAVHRGANRIFRRAAHSGEHGGGPLDALAFCLFERPARDRKTACC